MSETAPFLDTALDLIARHGYASFTLPRLAAAADVPLADIYRVFASRADVLRALRGRIDAVLAAGFAEASQEPARDRLFDVVMARFDALKAFKPALLVIARELRQVPGDVLILGPGAAQSMKAMLAAAGIDGSRLFGRARVAALTLIYARVLRVWLDDEDAGLAKTMAALDRGLRRPEQIDPRFWG